MRKGMGYPRYSRYPPAIWRAGTHYTGEVLFLRRKLCLVSVVVILLITMPFAALSHSGRTDGRGGHKDNKNKSGLGSYHYHCGGHSPHLHENGACPYSKTQTTKSKETKQPSPKPTLIPAPISPPTSTPRPTPKPVINREVDQEIFPDIELPIDLPYKRGDVGGNIKEMQERLIELGYLNDIADGIFGIKTEAAVRCFAEDYEFEPNGIIEEDTYIAIMYWEYEQL